MTSLTQWLLLARAAGMTAALSLPAAAMADASAPFPVSQLAELVALLDPVADPDPAWLTAELRLTEEQLAEVQALRLLADDRFGSHIGGTDLAEGVVAVLSAEQRKRLGALLGEGGARVAGRGQK